MNIHTLCDELFHGDLIPSDREHFPEVAADPRAGPGPGHTSEPAALGLRHSGKLLHRFAFFFLPPKAVFVQWNINHDL